MDTGCGISRLPFASGRGEMSGSACGKPSGRDIQKSATFPKHSGHSLIYSSPHNLPPWSCGLRNSSSMTQNGWQNINPGGTGMGSNFWATSTDECAISFHPDSTAPPTPTYLGRCCSAAPHLPIGGDLTLLPQLGPTDIREGAAINRRAWRALGEARLRQLGYPAEGGGGDHRLGGTAISAGAG